MILKKYVKRTNYCVLILLAALTMFSCKKDKKSVDFSGEEKISDTDLNMTNSFSKAVFSDSEVNNVYQSYLVIKAALVNSDSQAVQQEAKKLEASLDQSLQNKQLKSTSKLISLTKGIKEQRNFFVTLTKETEKLIQSSEITSGAVYKQFCPMAFDGEGGYWLSDSKEIRNPFFGNKMLACGHVKEVFE